MRHSFDPLTILVAILRHPRRVNAGAAVALALTMGGVALARSSGPVPASSVTITLPPATPAALFPDTSALDIQTTGEAAKLYNASLPFLGAAPTPATPFILSGSDAQRARALLCMTQAVYYEAAGEPVEGQRAVAQVVLNRVRHPAFAKSVCGVVYQGVERGRCQFSFVCDGALDRRPRPSGWRTAEMIARQALYGYVEPSVGEATHYHADYVAPRWAPLLAKVTAIGQHIFYRWPGAWGQPQAFSGRYAGETQDAAAVLAAAEAEGVAAKLAEAKPKVTYQIAALLDPVAAPAEADKEQSSPPAAAAASLASAAAPAATN